MCAESRSGGYEGLYLVPHLGSRPGVFKMWAEVNVFVFLFFTSYWSFCGCLSSLCDCFCPSLTNTLCLIFISLWLFFQLFSLCHIFVKFSSLTCFWRYPVYILRPFFGSFFLLHLIVVVCCVYLWYVSQDETKSWLFKHVGLNPACLFDNLLQSV